MSTEYRLVAAIQRAVRREHPSAWEFKVVGSPYQMAGVPDLLYCLAGRLVAIEVKHCKPGESREHAYGRVTAQQRVQIARIRAAGGIADVALTEGEALAIFAGASPMFDPFDTRATPD